MTDAGITMAQKGTLAGPPWTALCRQELLGLLATGRAGWRVVALPPFAARIAERRLKRLGQELVFPAPLSRRLRDPSNVSADLQDSGVERSRDERVPQRERTDGLVDSASAGHSADDGLDRSGDGGDLQEFSPLDVAA